MPSKDGQLDKNTPTTILDVKMQNALIVDQSRFLFNSSLAMGKKKVK